MSKSRGAVAALPAAIAWLCLALTTPAAHAQGPRRSAPEGPTGVPQTEFCPNNRFQNGDFSITSAGPNDKGDQDINVATGWEPIWASTNDASLADLYGPGTKPQNFIDAPPAASGNYASMWIVNDPDTNVAATYREGMFNDLTTDISATPADTYSFTFNTAPLYPKNAGGAPAVIGVYGVNWDSSNPLPGAPQKLNDPPNADNGVVDGLFDHGRAALLGTVTIPVTAGNDQWVQQTITFNSSDFALIGKITHVMVTRADNHEYPAGVTPVKQGRYIAFDDFCMRTQSEEQASSGGGTASIDLSTCCPPSAAFPLKTMFSSVQGNVANSYHLKFTMNASFDAQMTAYVALVKAMDASFNGLAMTIRIFNGGSGATPSVPAGSQPLEPDAGIHWHAGGGSGNPWASSFFTSASDQPTNSWTVVEMTVWTLGPGRPWPQSCEVRRFAFRPEVVDLP